MSSFSLKNKLIFVLGGSGLIGFDSCKMLLSHGARVVNLDLKNIKYRNLIYVKFDITGIKKIKKNIDKIVKKYGCPDVFVNCSYPVTKNWKNATFSKVNENLIFKNLAIHQGSYIWVSRLIAEHMKKNKKEGSIIQFSSIYGSVGQNLKIYEGTGMKENMVYSSIKSGIINNSKQMASYYGRYGIRVNSISPGAVIGHVKGSKKSQNKIFIKNFSKLNPLGRLAKPHEISPAVVFLSSNASSYITGINLIIDGGWTAI